MKSKPYIVKTNPRENSRRIFFKEQVKAGDLITALGTLEESTPLGWQYKMSFICPGLWSREGAFHSVSETFVDAFDHTVYKAAVWKYSNDEEESSINGLELHEWIPTDDSSGQGGIVLLKTIGDLKCLLSFVSADTPVFSPSTNFELKGNLVNTIGFYCIEDIDGRVWAMLETD